MNLRIAKNRVGELENNILNVLNEMIVRKVKEYVN